MEGSSNKVNECLAFIKTSPVVMYSKSWCGYCADAKSVLKKGAVDYKLVELDTFSEGGDVQAALYQMTKQRTVPSIFIGGTHVGGCSEFKAALKSGTAQKLLNDNGISHKF
mmetsp:Transcript_179/g.192  ORF Transcript_179/g.192 Transcript_179/m.192 type:complete len:111 (-) Transcript_179:64-396(-)